MSTDPATSKGSPPSTCLEQDAMIQQTSANSDTVTNSLCEDVNYVENHEMTHLSRICEEKRQIVSKSLARLKELQDSCQLAQYKEDIKKMREEKKLYFTRLREELTRVEKQTDKQLNFGLKSLENIFHHNNEIFEDLQSNLICTKEKLLDKDKVMEAVTELEELLSQPDTIHVKEPSVSFETKMNNLMKAIREFDCSYVKIRTKCAFNGTTDNVLSYPLTEFVTHLPKAVNGNDLLDTAAASNGATNEECRVLKLLMPMGCGGSSAEIDCTKNSAKQESIIDKSPPTLIYFNEITEENHDMNIPSRSCCEQNFEIDRTNCHVRSKLSHRFRLKWRQPWKFLPHRKYKNIQIIYSISPHEFYVFKVFGWEPRSIFENALSSVSESMIPFDSNQKIEEKYYAACIDQKWYRVFVNKINGSFVEVWKADYGDTVQIPLTSVWNIPKEIEKINDEGPLVVHCSLSHCFPYDTPQWSEDAIKYFKSLVSGGGCTIEVVQFVQNKMLVNLEVARGNVANIMIRSRKARSTAKVLGMEVKNNSLSQSFYYDQDYSFSKRVLIHVLHVTDPSHFYVRRVGDPTKTFEKMANELNEFYTDKQNYWDFCIENPTVGSLVAVRCDKGWRRGEIKSHKNKYYVKCVDYGTREGLSLCNIRALSSQFIRVTAQATECSLMDVRSLGRKWTPENKNKFQNIMTGKNFHMLVSQIGISGCLRVFLYEDNEKDICINEKVIELGIARGCGSLANVKSLETDIASIFQESCSVSEVEESIELNNLSDRNEKKIKVKITLCVSPNEIYLQTPQTEAKINKLVYRMSRFYRESHNINDTRINDVTGNMKCAVYDKKSRLWFRGIIVKELIRAFKVFLYDYGYERNFSTEDVRMLADEFKMIPNGVLKSSLYGCKTETEWDTSYCKKLKELITKFQELFIIKKGNEGDTLVVELWGKNVLINDPLEPTVEEFKKINDLLLLMDSVPPDDKNTEQLNLVVSNVDLASDHVNRWLQSSSAVATVPPTKKYLINWLHSTNVKLQTSESNENLSSRSTISCNAKKSCVPSLEIYTSNKKTDWLPSEELEETVLNVTCTYVDTDMNIFFRPHSEKGKFETISKRLQSRFENSTPTEEDKIWTSGEICIAKYYPDNKWYRGRVLKVNDDLKQALVNFVDFGGNEWTLCTHLRKLTPSRNTPILCHKLQLRSDLKPMKESEDGNWDREVSNLVYELIIDKECLVTLKMEEREDVYRIHKLVQGEEDVLFMLVDYGHATCPAFNSDAECDESESEISDMYSCTDSSAEPQCSPSLLTNLNLKTPQDQHFLSLSIIKQVIDADEMEVIELSLPDTKELFVICVTEVLAHNVIAVNAMECSYNEDIKQGHLEFMNMYEELQKYAQAQPIVKPPYIGRVCCSQFTDKNWYRAIIIGEINDKVAIYYLDYGNVHTVYVSQLHQMRKNWFQIPARALKCWLQSTPTDLKNDADTKVVLENLLNKDFKARITAIPDIIPKQYAIELLEYHNGAIYRA